jgi:single stranded DNA-binding protein
VPFHLNLVVLLGNMGKPPRMHGGEGTGKKRMAFFQIATEKQWMDRNTGELKKATSWVNIVCWNAAADIAANFGKGDLVFVMGVANNHKFQQQGQVKYSMAIEANILFKVRSKAAPETPLVQPFDMVALAVELKHALGTVMPQEKVPEALDAVLQKVSGAGSGELFEPPPEEEEGGEDSGIPF